MEVIAGDVARVAVGDRAGGMAELVPDRRPAAALLDRSFNLIRRSGSAPYPIVGKDHSCGSHAGSIADKRLLDVEWRPQVRLQSGASFFSGAICLAERQLLLHLLDCLLVWRLGDGMDVPGHDVHVGLEDL